MPYLNRDILKKYALKAVLIKLFNLGDSALFQIKTMRVHCFIPDFTTLKFSDAWENSQGKELEGNAYSIFLFMGLLDVEKTSRHKSHLDKTNNFRYKLIGKIVDKTTSTMKYEVWVVDCGLPVFIEPPNWPKYKEYSVGDWVKAEGRLDVHVVANDKISVQPTKD